MTKQEKNDLKVELKSRKIIKKKLETAIRDLSRTIDRIRNDRLNRIEQLSQYKNEDDLADAYGWGFISESEYDTLLAQMREGQEKISKEISAEEIASGMLRGWLKITDGDIASLEFDLLSDAKKAEIRKRNEEITARREARRREQEEWFNDQNLSRLADLLRAAGSHYQRIAGYITVRASVPDRVPYKSIHHD